MAAADRSLLRIQLITAAGASFKLENGLWQPNNEATERPRPGELLHVKTIVMHPNEPGTRKAPDGTLLPRSIVHTFRAHLDGRSVFNAELGPGNSANPYVAFYLRASAPGQLNLEWRGDDGFSAQESVMLPLA